MAGTSTATAPLDVDDFMKSRNAAAPVDVDDFMKARQQSTAIEPNLPGGTPRLVAAAKASASPKVAEMVKPTEFEKAHTPEPENVGTWNRIKEYGRGVGGIIQGLSEAGLEGLSGPSLSTAKRASDIALADQERKAAGRSIPYRITAGGASLAGIDPTGMERAAEHGDPAGVGIETAVQGTPLAAAEIARIPAVQRGARTVAKFPGVVRERIGAAIHDPVTGEMTKGTEAIARAGGATVGGATGGLIGSIGGPTGAYIGSGTGITAGGIAGPSLMERMFPEPASRIAAREEFLRDKTITEAQEGAAKENRARDIAQKRVETQNEAKLREAEEARQKELADAERLKEQHAQSLMRRGREQELLDKKAEQESIGKIVTPETRYRPETGPAIESEGSPARWTNEKVLELARKGNRAAIAQAGVRQLDLPENARYVAGDLDYRNLITSPKEVTRFSPTGEPIRQETPAPIGRNMDAIARAGRTPRIVQAFQKPGEIPAVAGGRTLPLNFERPINVPSESAPVLLQPEAPQVEPPKPQEGYQGPERRSVPREPDTGERSWGFYKRMLREGSPEEQALARENLKRMAAPMEKPAATEPEAQPAEIKGVTEPVKPKAAKEKVVPIQKSATPEQIADAEGLIQQELGMLQASDRPGRYFDQSDVGDIRTGSTEIRGGDWRGVKSGREMQPWMRTTKFTPAQLEKALRNKDSALYQRAMKSALEFIRREKLTPAERAAEQEELGKKVASYFVKPKRVE